MSAASSSGGVGAAAPDVVIAPSHGPRVTHQVSDVLRDRLPFNPATGFDTQRGRDAGKVFNGFLPEAIDSLLDSVSDTSLDSTQKLKALEHLFSYSAAAERKIELVRKSAVPTLAAIMQAQPTPKIEAACGRLLRSLAVLPQAAHAVVEEGGLQACILCTMDRANLKEREDARVAASSAVSQIASSWCGRNWLLGLEVSESLQLEGRPIAPQMSAEGKAEQVELLLSALIGVLDKDRGCRRMLLNALMALAQITAVERGLHMTLVAGGLASVSAVLQALAADDVWVFAENPIESECVMQAATVVWHAGLDDLGKKEALQLPLVVSLARIAKSLSGTKDRYTKLKGTVAGAACALTLDPQLKRAAIEGEVLLAESILQLLREANEAFVPLHQSRKAGKAVDGGAVSIDDVLAIMKNSVQCIRLIAELPDGRKALATLVPPSEKELRRQLFASTPFQEEFGVWVY